ncbi:hypothetical protein NPIL_448241 [Nephila pilipes]|uniref:Uncharacterized protein n=1 Tax=Nephila pilipes TaxID=299642 RepID=A0A8X6IMZ0_NEPPI|nr:hypothetical protein NPIL_448241 [Nephila pilipes]
MEENKRAKNASDLDIPKQILVEKNTMQLLDSEKRNSMPLEKIDDVDYRYSYVIRYLLLQTVMITCIPLRICCGICPLRNNALSSVSKVIKAINVFFYGHFEDMRFIHGSEKRCIEFNLYRCEMLCGEPTYYNFLLVAAFVTHIVSRGFDEGTCFRILRLCEFLFDVLYRRIFWKVFNVKGFKNLMSFCDEFNRCFTTQHSISTLGETPFGAKWVYRVRNISNIFDHRFSLNESETELFRKNYSIENKREYESAISRELEHNYFYLTKIWQDTLVCKFCFSKCYNFMDHLTHFL